MRPLRFTDELPADEFETLLDEYSFQQDTACERIWDLWDAIHYPDTDEQNWRQDGYID